MRLRGLAIVLAILLLPTATAGSERKPEVTDDRDLPQMTAADVIAAWVSAEQDGLRVSIQSVDGSLPEEHPDFVYWLYFRVTDSDEEVGVALGFADDGVLRGFLGTGSDGGLNDAQRWRGPFDRVANGEVVELRESRGRPSTWSGVVPWGAVDGLEKGATLTDFVAGSARYDRTARMWIGGIDRAESDATYVAKVNILTAMGLPFPILVPAWMLPSIVLLCTAGGLAAGYGASRLAGKKAAPASGAPRVVPVHTAPPPGSRFQRAPPRVR